MNNRTSKPATKTNKSTTKRVVTKQPTKRTTRVSTVKGVSNAKAPIQKVTPATEAKVIGVIQAKGQLQPMGIASLTGLPIAKVRIAIRALKKQRKVQSNGRGSNSFYSVAAS